MVQSKRELIPLLLFYASEMWMGYIFWSTIEFFAFQIYFFSLLVTAGASASYIFLIFFILPSFVGIKKLRDILVIYLSSLRFPAAFAIFMYLLPYHIGRTIAFAFATTFVLSHFFIAHYQEAVSKYERQAVSYGIVLGLLLEMVLRLAYLSRNPIHGEVAVTVIFGIITIICISYSQYFSFKLKKSATLKIEEGEPYDNASIEMQILKKQGTGSSSKSGTSDTSSRSKDQNLGKIEYIWWIFVAFSLASFVTIPLYTLVSSEIIPRWVGMRLGFPAASGVILSYLIGVMGVEVFRKNVLWFALLLVAIGLYGHLTMIGGYIGGLLVALVTPVALIQLFDELPRMKYLWPSILLGSIIYIVWVVCILGGYVVGYAPLGSLVDRSPRGILWALVVFLGLFLIVASIRDIIAKYKKEENTGLKAKRIFQRIFSFQKGIPTAEVLICLIFLLSLGVAFTIVRGVEDFATKKLPKNNGEITVVSFNIFQGATYPTGKPNMDEVKETLEENEPDIVHLQESNSNNMFDLSVDSVNYLSSHLRLHQIYGPRGEQLTWGVSALTTYEPKDPEVSILPFNSTSTLTRPLLQYYITVGDTQIKMMNVHMEFDPSGSLLQAYYLADLVANTTGPLIFTGDFNVQPNSQEYAILASTGIRNAYGDAHAGVFEKTYIDGTTIDYIWYRDLQLISSEVLLLDESYYVSDHYPVIAKFELLPNV